MSQGKIVLMACGSFSPPTYMHLRMFEIAKDYVNTLGLGTVVGGIMSPVHDAYGKKDLVAAPHRIAMLKLALRSSAWIKVSEWETQQSGWTRTRISMQYHQDTINEHLSSNFESNYASPAWIPDDILNVNSIDEPDNVERLNGNVEDKVTVKLLCGGDLLESFATPGLWSDEDLETIVGKHGLVVVSRAGSDPGRFIYESDMLYKHRKNVVLVTNYIANEVSSTVIRRLVRRAESAKYLTDDAILHYIKQHRLYNARSDAEYLSNLLNFGKRSPQDVIMTSPEETTFKNILISIRDKPSIIDETVTVKRQRKSNFLLPNQTDSVSPITDTLKPKMAYLDKVPGTYVPGKAVKIVSDATQHAIQDEKVSLKGEKASLKGEKASLKSEKASLKGEKANLKGEKASLKGEKLSLKGEKLIKDELTVEESTYSSLDSYLRKDDIEYELYRRRVSEGNVEQNLQTEPIKKRCSSTIRKLRPEDLKKSKSEVSKLCDKMKSIKMKERESKNYKTRSCNDIVRLILTKHGIHVISDTEAIV